MYKAKIVKGWLNVRSRGPNRKSPVVRVLEMGEEVNVIRSTYGEKIDNESLWYQLEDETFIWAGRVAVSDEIDMPIEKRVIFTADDYGVIDSINDGIKDAVKKGLLNSVTCFTNYVDVAKGKSDPARNKSLANIRELEKLKADYQLELGVHLSITSGSPLLGRDRVPLLCLQDDDKTKQDKKAKKDDAYFEQSDFYNYTGVRSTYKNAILKKFKTKYLKQLREELSAQLDVFANPPDGGTPIAIDSITSHHNTLLYHEDLFNIMVSLSKEYGAITRKDRKPIPLRSLKNIPSWKDAGFLLTKGKVLFPGHRMRQLRKIMNEKANLEVKSPGLLHSNHFGPLPLFEMKFEDTMENLVAKKVKRCDAMLDDHEHGMFGKNDHGTMEFLLHLRKGEVKTHKGYKDEVLAHGYAGINHLSFDGRTGEHGSFTTYFKRRKDQKKGKVIYLRPHMTIGTWADL